MSLLSSQVFANTTTPCWVPAGGGTITGSLLVTGGLDVEGTIVSSEGGGVVSKNSLTAAEGVVVEDAAGVAQLRLAVVNGGSSFIQSNNVLKFGQMGAGDANTSLTTSVFDPFGNGTDAFLVGGTLTANELRGKKLDLLGSDIPDPAQVCGSGQIAIGTSTSQILSTAITATSKIFLTLAGATFAPGVLSTDPALNVPGVSADVVLIDPATGGIITAVGDNVGFNFLIIG